MISRNSDDPISQTKKFFSMMAFYDNKLWLLSHIHNSFITSDDSGVCQMVLGSSEFKEELRVVARNQASGYKISN